MPPDAGSAGSARSRLRSPRGSRLAAEQMEHAWRPRLLRPPRPLGDVFLAGPWLAEVLDDQARIAEQVDPRSEGTMQRCERDLDSRALDDDVVALGDEVLPDGASRPERMHDCDGDSAVGVENARG